MTEKKLKSVTRMIQVVTLIACVCWVSCSYIIAAYASICLQQPFPVVELSQQAMNLLAFNCGCKVVGNVVEHNSFPFKSANTYSEEI